MGIVIHVAPSDDLRDMEVWDGIRFAQGSPPPPHHHTQSYTQGIPPSVQRPASTLIHRRTCKPTFELTIPVTKSSAGEHHCLEMCLRRIRSASAFAAAVLAQQFHYLARARCMPGVLVGSKREDTG
eukprot:1015993-Pelagomonas_calceolata.AAC.3